MSIRYVTMFHDDLTPVVMVSVSVNLSKEVQVILILVVCVSVWQWAVAIRRAVVGLLHPRERFQSLGQTNARNSRCKRQIHSGLGTWHVTHNLNHNFLRTMLTATVDSPVPRYHASTRRSAVAGCLP